MLANLLCYCFYIYIYIYIYAMKLGNKTWKKKSTESCFDVTMGSFHGAEIYELMGLYSVKPRKYTS